MAKKILVVDDEPDILQVAVFRLKKAGYEVMQAVNGREAIELIKTLRPDLVLLDLRLPEVSGFDVCKTIKADDTLKSTPIIIFTASVNSLDEKIKEIGADGYLSKPFDPDQLLEKIRSILS